MGYLIEYDSERNHKFYTHRKKNVPAWLAFALIGAVLICIFGRQIRELLIPGDPQVTVAAFKTLTEDIKAGDTLKDAVAAFCREIIDNAVTAQ